MSVFSYWFFQLQTKLISFSTGETSADDVRKAVISDSFFVCGRKIAVSCLLEGQLTFQVEITHFL